MAWLLILMPTGITGQWCVAGLSWFYHGCLPANRPLDPDVSEWKQIANFVVRACWAGWTCYKQIAAPSPFPTSYWQSLLQPPQCVSAPSSTHLDKCLFHLISKSSWKRFNQKINQTEQLSAVLKAATGDADYITSGWDISSEAIQCILEL